MAVKCDWCNQWVILAKQVYLGDYWERQRPQFVCFGCLDHSGKEQCNLEVDKK